VSDGLLIFEAVLEDIQARGGTNAYWVLGDLVALGYDPLATLERLTALPNVSFVRGNTDRYVVTGDRPPPALEAARDDPRLVPKAMEVTHSFAWPQGYVTARGWIEWLAELPLEQRLTLSDGTRLLGVHAAPGTDDGTGVHPGLSDAELQTLPADCGADLVCVGHVHWPLDRQVGDVRAVTLGSVSNPLAPDLRASYVLLEADTSSYRLQHQRVDYDLQAVIDAVRQSRHPAPEFIVRHIRGQQRPPWNEL
jgi:predicted phosphodiesterase